MRKKLLMVLLAIASALTTSIALPKSAHATTTDFCTFYGGSPIFGFPPPSSNAWNWFTSPIHEYGYGDRSYTAFGIYPQTAGGGQCQLTIALRVYTFYGDGYGFGIGQSTVPVLDPAPRLRGWYQGCCGGWSATPTSWARDGRNNGYQQWSWSDAAIWGPGIFHPSNQLGWDNLNQQFALLSIQNNTYQHYGQPYIGYNCNGNYQPCASHG